MTDEPKTNSDDRPQEINSGQRCTIDILPGQPLKLVTEATPETTGAVPALSSDSFFSAISETFARYREALHKLLEGKYADLKQIAPLHMRERCNIYIIRCKDGIFIRYDLALEEQKDVMCFEPSKSLAEIAPLLSDNIIHFPDDPNTYVPGNTTFELSLTKTAAMDENTEQVLRCRPLIYAKLTFPDSFQIPPPPARPPCLVSVNNEVQYHLGGIIGPKDAPLEPGQPHVQNFVAQGPRVRLPLGWQAIEIYPVIGEEHWKPEYGPLWAEIDLLAAVAHENLRQSKLNTLDSRGATRTRYTALLAEFECLLNGPEEPVHQFLKQHPELLCPTAVKRWSKLTFGDRVSDFVFCEPHNDYLLVEIEAPVRELFRKDGQQREELTHAINQILDWIQYIGDNKEKVEEELWLRGISTNPRSLIVIGRSASLTDDDRRKLSTIQAQHNKLRVLTYDDLLTAARANLERILGPLGVQEPATKLYYY